MMSPHTVTILGDVMVDISCDIGEHLFRNITQQTFLYRPISMRVGGTGVGLAVACRDYFRRVNLLCKLGDDSLGEVVRKYLLANEVKAHCVLDPEVPTGLVLELNETASDEPLRLMIGSAISAGRNLTVRDVEERADLLSETDVFATDGYCILRQPRRDATFRAIELGRSNGAIVVFDIVPHDAHNYLSLAKLRPFLDMADIIVTEVRTIRHFLEISAPSEVYNRELAVETIELLRQIFPATSFFLRYGNRNMSNHSLIAVPGRPYKHKYNGYSESERKVGFGDRLTASDLKEYLEVVSRASQ